MTLLARDLMQPEPITIPAAMPFPQIQHLFVVARIGGAPVVDERGTVVGVVSTADLLGALDQAFDDDIDPAPPGDPAPESPSAIALPEGLGALTARELATPDAIWVSPEASPAEVARVMRAEGVHRVLVGRDGQLAGILTAFDLLRVMPGA
ncbi:MAG: CBS domain-containing protein [Deltaproteobacteria bacterium]|nr:CBS domain-containing protein [Kofleriaceae bacterium]